MMWLSDMFTARKQKLFASLLSQHSEVMLQAAQALERYVERPDPAAIARVSQLTQQSHDILRQTIAALTDTFVTPFDRQDIYNLALAFDDMIAYLDNAAREITLFDVEPTPAMVEMVKVISGATDAIHEAIAALEDDQTRSAQRAADASSAEDVVEDMYRRTLADLFKTTDVQRIFKLREIYRHLSNSADRADAIGKLVGKIVVKVA
ncbi:MAG TPA: DUF47 family protein [Candidatus Eremiobacteraceae bacterium]|nr:DUF47 family protein [Candidatus Eremiobacteraceae bacterium]